MPKLNKLLFSIKSSFVVPVLVLAVIYLFNLISVPLLYIDILPVPTTLQDLSHLETFVLAAFLFLPEMFSIKL